MVDFMQKKYVFETHISDSETTYRIQQVVDPPNLYQKIANYMGYLMFFFIFRKFL